MINNIAINYHNPAVLRKIGLDALCKELGPVGMAYFIRQYEAGEGDYTSEREQFLSGISMEDIKSQLQQAK